MPGTRSNSRRYDIDTDDLQRQVADIFASVKSGSSHAGPSRTGAANANRRQVNRTYEPAEDDDGAHSRDDLERLLKDVQRRLDSELARAEEAEERARAADARAAVLKVAHKNMENETRAARESLRLYQAELTTAISQVQAGNSELERLAAERNDAEQAAARARTHARKATEMLTAEIAREEGRREGLAMGRREGMRLSRGRRDAPDNEPVRESRASFPADLASLRDDLASPTRPARVRRSVIDAADPGPSRTRRRAGSVDPPQREIPDVAPMARPLPRMSLATPSPSMPEVARATPGPVQMFQPLPRPSKQRLSRVKSPPSVRARDRKISAPIPIERPITPQMVHNSGEPHQHSPVEKLPDTYIPTFDAESEVPFPLPPPHELGSMPATPSVTSRPTLPPTTSTNTLPPSQVANTIAAGAAKAFTKGMSGMRSIFKQGKRASTAMSDLTLLRNPMQISHPLEANGTGRRPALSVIIENSSPAIPQMPVPRPGMNAVQEESPERPIPRRHPSDQPSMDSGLQNWTAAQHRQRMATELRNSNPDIESEFTTPLPSGAESIRSGTTSYYHRYHRPKVRMPEPLGPSKATIAHLQEQAELIDSRSASSHGPSEGLYSGRTPIARSTVSSRHGSSRRKAPPAVRESMFSPPNSAGPSSAGPSSAGIPMPIPYGGRTTSPLPMNVSAPTPVHPRHRSSSIGGPAIQVTRPRSNSGGSDLLGADNVRPMLRRQGSASSIGSAASSLRSKRSAYKRFQKDTYVDPSAFAVNHTAQNPFAPGTEGAAAYDRSRPPSPAATASNW